MQIFRRVIAERTGRLGVRLAIGRPRGLGGIFTRKPFFLELAMTREQPGAFQSQQSIDDFIRKRIAQAGAGSIRQHDHANFLRRD